jgi:hypothetical protein
MLAVAEKRLIQYACQDVFIWKKKDESERMGGIEMPAPYPYPRAHQSHCMSPTSLEIIAVAVAGIGGGDWKWKHPCFFANCGAQSESFVLGVEGSRRERRSGCRCHPNTPARTAQQPSNTQEQHLVVWPNGIFAFFSVRQLVTQPNTSALPRTLVASHHGRRVSTCLGQSTLGTRLVCNNLAFGR